jgi:ribose-phosphate pyrophosphokinase
MIANLLNVAGVDHVITIDLHATQMQGFFKCPVDNLVAEPLIARWIKHNVKDWQNAVVVSKNPGGTKRVTSLADALKLSFGIVTTDRRRPNVHSQDYSVNGSIIFERFANGGTRSDDGHEAGDEADKDPQQMSLSEPSDEKKPDQNSGVNGEARPARRRTRGISNTHLRRGTEFPSSPLAKSALPGTSPLSSPTLEPLTRSTTVAADSNEQENDGEFTDEVGTVSAHSVECTS